MRFQGVLVHDTKQRDVRAIGKTWVAFQSRAERAPVEIEIRHEHRALRITDVENYAGVSWYEVGVQILDRCRAHVHLKGELAAIAFQQMERFDARAGGNVN